MESFIDRRDKLRVQLIGKPFDGKRTGWEIKDVIIAEHSNVGEVYQKMWQNDLTNEIALAFFKNNPEKYKVFVISHQWPWGSGDLLYEDSESYLKNNPI